MNGGGSAPGPRASPAGPPSGAPVVGTSFPEVAFGPLSRADIARYAGASGDFNPIHIDDDYAWAAGAPGVFAMGMLPAGYLATALSRWFGGALGVRRFKVRFAARVWPGDVLVCTGRVASVTGGVAAVELVARRRGPGLPEGGGISEEVAVVGEAEVAVGGSVGGA